MISALRLGRKALEATGVLGRTSLGFPVKHRKKRLLTASTALLVALGTWAGLPEPVAQALAEFLVEAGLTAAE